MTLLIKQVMSLCDVKTVICVSDSKFFICNVGCQAYNMSGGNSSHAVTDAATKLILLLHEMRTYFFFIIFWVMKESVI